MAVRDGEPKDVKLQLRNSFPDGFDGRCPFPRTFWITPFRNNVSKIFVHGCSADKDTPLPSRMFAFKTSESMTAAIYRYLGRCF